MTDRLRPFIVYVTIVHLLAGQFTSPLYGQQSTTSLQPISVVVPPVVGLSAEVAKKKLENLGLVATFEVGTPAAFSDSAFKAYRQEPRSGKKVRRGSRVKILLYDESPQTSEDFVFATAHEISSVRSIPFQDEVQESIAPLTGSLSHSSMDLSVDAGTTTLVLERIALADPRPPGLLGTRWRLSCEKRVLHNQKIAVVFEGSDEVVFQIVKTGHYRSAFAEQLIIENRTARRLCADGGEEFFDESGRIISRKEAGGSELRFTYRDDGRLKSIVGPFHSSMIFEYNDDLRLSRVSGSNGAIVEYSYEKNVDDLDLDASTITYLYDDVGNISEWHHPSKGHTKFGRDDLNRIVTRSWADGASETFEFSTDGKTVQHIDADGQIRQFSRIPGENRVVVINPDGGRTSSTADEYSRTIQITGPDGNSSKLNYDSDGNLSSVNNDVTGRLQYEYEENIRLPSLVTEPNGQKTLLKYDDSGQLISVFSGDDDNKPVTLEYNQDGLLTTIKSGTLAVRKLFYDKQGRLISAEDAGKAKSTWEYDRSGQVLQSTNPLGNSYNWGYDSVGYLKHEINPLGQVTRYEYYKNGLLKNVLDAGGGQTHYSYDSRGQVTEIIGPSEGRTQYKYTSGGLIRSVDYGNKNQILYEYDFRGNPTKTINSLGGGWAWTYDKLGRLLTVQNPLGGKTTRSYNQSGLLASFERPDGQQVKYEYDKSRQLQKITRNGDDETVIAWSENGKIKEIQPNRGPAFKYDYDKRDRLIRIHRGNTILKKYQYDEMGRMTRLENGSGRALQFQYDLVGNLSQVRDDDSLLRAVNYDALNRPVMISDSTGASVRYEYSPTGQLISITDPLGNVTKRSHTKSGHIQEVIAPNRDSVRCEYNETGWLTTLHRPGGGKSIYEHDSAGNVIRQEDPLGREMRAAYDKIGNVITTTDARKLTISYSYDQAGRIIQKNFPNGKKVQYSYNKRGQLTEVDDGIYPVLYKYDRFGNRIQIEYPAIKKVLNYEYNDLNQLVRMTSFDGRVFQYKYNQNGQVVAIKLPDGKEVQYQLNNRDSVSELTYPNGLKAKYNYDTEGRYTKLTWTSNNSEEIYNWQYDYDRAGRRSRVIDSQGNKTEYQYDVSGQLTAVNGNSSRFSLKYGQGGRRQVVERGDEMVEYAYDEAGQLRSAGDTSFRYDANGNMAERRTPDGKIQYEYDTENRLRTVHLPDGKQVEYGYSATGERAWRTDEKGTTYYITDGVNLLGELNKDHETLASYVHAPGIDRPVLVSKGETHYFFVQDALGNIPCITDDSGQTVAQNDFGPFGETDSDQQPEMQTSLGFKAREYDQATGLYYFRARWYDPEHGCFLQKDPIAGRATQPLSLNPYIYAFNDPIQYEDPLGLAAKTRTTPKRIFRNGQWHNVFFRGHTSVVVGPNPAAPLNTIQSRAMQEGGRAHSLQALTHSVGEPVPVNNGASTAFRGIDGTAAQHQASPSNMTNAFPNSSVISLSADTEVPTRPHFQPFEGRAGEIVEIHVPENQVAHNRGPDGWPSGARAVAVPDKGSVVHGVDGVPGRGWEGEYVWTDHEIPPHMVAAVHPPGIEPSLPPTYLPGEGPQGVSSFSPNANPSIGQKIKNGIVSAGESVIDGGKKALNWAKGGVKRVLPLLAVLGIYHAANNVAQASSEDRPHVAAEETGGLAGGSLGGTIGTAGGVIAVTILGAGPFGAGIIVFGTSFVGGEIGDSAGRYVGGRLVPPGESPPTGADTNLFPDEGDFDNPAAGGPRNGKGGKRITFPGFDPRDFADNPGKSGEGNGVPQNVNYQVIYQCRQCLKVHHGGVFKDSGGARSAAQRYAAEGYTVGIVVRAKQQ